MYPSHKHTNKQKGIGLPGAIFIITILALLTVFIGDLTQSSQTSFTQNINSNRAFFAAESGAEIALHRVLFAGASCDASLSDISFSSSGLESCSADLSCTLSTVSGANYYTIESEGECGANQDFARRKVQVRAVDSP